MLLASLVDEPSASSLTSARGLLPTRWRSPAHPTHRLPRRAGRASLRGADGGGGFLLGLLAALPPRRSLGRGRQPGVGAGRPVDHPEPSAEAAPPQAARPARRRRRGHRTPTRDGQRRRADQLCRQRRALAVLPQRRRRRVRVRRSPAPAPSRPSSAPSTYRTGDYVVIPRATTHRWLPSDVEGRSRGSTPSRRTATSPHRSATSPATASSSSTRRTASATCTLPPNRSCRRAPTWRCSSSTAATARPAWSGRD